MTDCDLILHYLDHPEHFVFDVWCDYFTDTKGEDTSKWLDSWAIEVLHALREYQYVAVTGANAVGKTTIECFAKYWFLSTREDSIVPMTSVDQHHLRSIVWTESRRWYDRSPEIQKTFEHTATRVRHRERPGTWFGESRTARKQGDPGGTGVHAAGLQGFHADHLLFLIDEGSAVDDTNWESAESSIRKEDQRLMAISNPLRVFGRMFEVFNLDKYHAMWYTRSVSYEESTNINPVLARKQIEMLGEDSPVVQVRYYGKFPKRGAEDTLPTYEAVMAAISRMFEADAEMVRSIIECYRTKGLRVSCEYSLGHLEAVYQKLLLKKKFVVPEFNIDILMRAVVEYDGRSELRDRWEELQYKYFVDKPRLGLDIARFGGSKTVYCVRRGMRILELVGFHGLRGPEIKARVENYFTKYPDLECAMVDATGIAGGILTDFVDPTLYPCIDVAFGGVSSQPLRYFNLAAEMWWAIVENIASLMLPDNDVLVTQLTTRKYTYVGKTSQLIQIESKKDMAKRRLVSPDEADAVGLTFAPVDVGVVLGDEDQEWPEVEQPPEPGTIQF